MKVQLITSFFALSVMFLFMSFSPATVNKEPSALITLQNSWGQWKTTSCFKYLEYRVRKQSYANEWAIEFRNGYNKSISMSVSIEDGYGGDRFTIASGDSEVRTAYYTDDKQASYINFGIDKVKFGDTSWGGPYANCDY